MSLPFSSRALGQEGIHFKSSDGKSVMEQIRERMLEREIAGNASKKLGINEKQQASLSKCWLRVSLSPPSSPSTCGSDVCVGHTILLHFFSVKLSTGTA